MWIYVYVCYLFVKVTKYSKENYKMQSIKADELPENPRERSNPISELMLW